jgi:3-hydroxypropanoate dehydrogenase
MTTAVDLLQITPADADLLFRKARSVHSFTDEPITEEHITALYELIKFGPTSMNTQPLRLVLAQSEGARTHVLASLAEGNRAKGESAPLLAVLAADVDFHNHLAKVLPHSPNAGDRFAAMDESAREKYAKTQAWLQAGYFIIGVRALGLAAGPMGGFDAAALDATLLAGTSLRSMLVVNIGFPEEASRDRLPRLDYSEAVISL